MHTHTCKTQDEIVELEDEDDDDEEEEEEGDDEG